VMSFRGGRLADLRLPAGTVWLLTGIAEAKGRRLPAGAPGAKRAIPRREGNRRGSISTGRSSLSDRGRGRGADQVVE
jgi:hypothetical protein